MTAIKDKLSFKVALLSISLFLTIPAQIAAATPLLYQAFPEIDKSAIETLITIPNFGIMLGLFLSPILIKYIGQRPTIILGLLVVMLAGTFPMYSTSFPLILLSRFILGSGVGLFNSLAVSLIPQFYSDDEGQRATMLGYQNVMGSLGAAFMSFLMGYLVTISWQAAFSIYFLVLPAIALLLFFAPLDKLAKAEQTQEKVKQSVNKYVVLISVTMLFVFIFLLPISYKVPALLLEKNLGSLSAAAMVSGFSTLVGIPVGASFGFVYKKLRDKLFSLGWSLVSLGFFGMAVASNLIFLLASVVLVGVGAGLAIPYMYNWLGQVAPKESVNLAMTVALVMVNIGAFLSPSVMAFLGGLLGQAAYQTLIMSGLGFSMIAFLAFLHYVKIAKSYKN